MTGSGRASRRWCSASTWRLTWLAAAIRDDIADALDYSAVVTTVRTVVTEGKFQLIETAAERVAERVRADYRLSWVRVEVAKPLPGEGYTAVVTIERGRR